MRARAEGRRAGGKEKGKKRRNEQTSRQRVSRRRRVPHQQGKGRTRSRGTHREEEQPQATPPRHAKHSNPRQRARGEHRSDGGRVAAPRTRAPRHTPDRHVPKQTHRHHAHHAHPHPAACPKDGRHTHTQTPAPTASERRTLATRPIDGQPGEGECLTPGATHNSAGHPPPRDALPPPSQRKTPARKSARCGAGTWSPRTHYPRRGDTGNGAWPPAPATCGWERESA